MLHVLFFLTEIVPTVLFFLTELVPSCTVRCTTSCCSASVMAASVPCTRGVRHEKIMEFLHLLFLATVRGGVRDVPTLEQKTLRLLHRHIMTLSWRCSSKNSRSRCSCNVRAVTRKVPRSAIKTDGGSR